MNDDIICTSCGLVYQVHWSYDGGESPIYFCPRCGSNDLEDLEEKDADEI